MRQRRVDRQEKTPARTSEADAYPSHWGILLAQARAERIINRLLRPFGTGVDERTDRWAA